jgi:predicted secreted protein
MLYTHYAAILMQHFPYSLRLKMQLILLILATALAIPAYAGNQDELAVIGFSKTGQYFAFELHGIADGSAQSYSEIQIMDVPANRWVGERVIYRTPEEVLETKKTTDSCRSPCKGPQSRRTSVEKIQYRNKLPRRTSRGTIDIRSLESVRSGKIRGRIPSGDHVRRSALFPQA